MRARGALAVLVVLLAWPSSVPGKSFLPPGKHIFAGVTGGSSITRYQRMVGKHPAVWETFITWFTPTGWLAPVNRFRSRLGLHLSTAPGYAKPGVITPQGIAGGQSDRWLIQLGRNIARSKRVVYVRIMAEMNGYWNPYAPFSADGSFRGLDHSPSAYIQAWRRTALILRGGRVAKINARLRSLGLPPVRARGRLARPKVALLWVPQDAGSPDIASNAPGVFWPGGEYVDWVGTDFYSSYPNFALLDSFYNGFGGRPFVLSEWALYGSDDPGFVRALFEWVRAHRRVRMLNYYQGTAGGIADLGRYPGSRAELRRGLRSRVFSPYAPEFGHERRGGRYRSAPQRPPRPPKPGPPPSPPPCLPLLNLCV